MPTVRSATKKARTAPAVARAPVVAAARAPGAAAPARDNSEAVLRSKRRQGHRHGGLAITDFGSERQLRSGSARMTGVTSGAGNRSSHVNSDSHLSAELLRALIGSDR